MKLYTSFKTLVGISALASVSIAGVPLTWVGAAGIIAIGLLFVSCAKGLNVVFFLPLSFFLLLVMVLNIAYWSYFQSNIPSGATSPYPIFIALRYLSILSFVAIVVIVLKLCQSGDETRVIRFLVNFGMVVACYAIYVYFAQLTGLPELLPRSRLGTGGGEQATSFSYAFHRAMGSFREPSHLAEWLILPFVLSFIYKPKYFESRKIFMGVTILMTGSMTAIIALAIAAPLALGVTYWRQKVIRLSWGQFKGFFVSLILFSVMVLGMNLLLSGLLFETIDDRMREIIIGGMKASNRGYVYEYLEDLSLPLFGAGLGNANIAFSMATGSENITSFLSLYINVLYSAGLFGFIIFILILIYPLFKIITNNESNSLRRIFFLSWSYIAWLVAFGVHSEELTIMFGISYALLFFKTKKNRPHSQRLLPLR